jgi:hypothetical protein
LSDRREATAEGVVDIFDVLDCALRTRFLAVEDLPTAPIWRCLPVELSAALALTDEPPGDALRLIWQVRERLLGKPECSEERTRATAALRLGLLALMHRDGRLEVGELLTQAFHVADSYVCGVDPRPFLHLRGELASGNPDGGRLAELFAPYAAAAEQHVQQWGLCPGKPRHS